MLQIYCRTLKLRPLTFYTTSSFRPNSVHPSSPFQSWNNLCLNAAQRLSPAGKTFQIHIHSTLLTGNLSITRGFHASPRNQGLHFLPFLLGIFKSSTSISYVLGAVRVALTLIPVALMGRFGSLKRIRKLDRKSKDHPEMQAHRPYLLRRYKFHKTVVKVLLIVPTLLFALVVLASLERTPLTGRLRLIVLSPDEEEGIARDLSGSGWFTAIRDVLTTNRGPPKFIPPTDWRYMWAERILRRLESVIPALQDENRADEAWFDRIDPPYPPPADYPLVPRPRMAQSLHYLEPRNVASEHQGHHLKGDVPPRSVLGPPYSLLVTDQPDQSNAFSYGFGPNGSGGVVIFSGFLDEILRRTGGLMPSKDTRPASIPVLLSRLFSLSSSNPTSPKPTPAQDAQLAILVAHELAHLLLSHHLETLSSENIFWPSLASIITDLLRALLFPITMVGGPFINDALEQVGEIGKRHVATTADTCSSHLMEIEADVVSIRLLALAGWDARNAADFWEARISPKVELTDAQAQAQLPGVLPGSLWVSRNGDLHSTSHPVDELRVQKLREELARWEKERERARIHAKRQTAPAA